MLKKNTLTEEQLDIVRGGLEFPYVEKDNNQPIPFNDKPSGLSPDMSFDNPINDNPLSGYKENGTKEQKFIL